jgi:signal transduction histidine kinase
MRRGAFFVVATGILLLLGSYVLYTQRVVRQLRLEAARSSLISAQVYRGLADRDADPTALTIFLDLSKHITESGVPLIITDENGVPTAKANLPFESSLEDPRVREYVKVLDAANPPVAEPEVGTVHFGHTPLVQGLRIIPAAQAIMLILLLGAALYAYRARDRAEQQRVWAGMARESAHQLGTPLSSLSGWLELLRERDADPLAQKAVDHMTVDLERLGRVAHRFERIGRPPRRERVDIAAIATSVADYFRERVPSLVHAVRIETRLEGTPIEMTGDPVLLEWAIEALIKNALDALAGRSGTITVDAALLPEGAVRLVIVDDGPGISRDVRRRIFEPGFSTKSAGWGLGLSLTRRIVEEAHGGSIALLPTEKGAAFEVIFPA